MAIGPVPALDRPVGRPGGVLDPPGLGLVRAEQVGLGGGGAYYTPRISQADPTLWFVSCDMGGLYRSTDTGAHWSLVPGLSSPLGYSIAIDATDTSRIYVGTFLNPQDAFVMRIAQ